MLYKPDTNWTHIRADTYENLMKEMKNINEGKKDRQRLSLDALVHHSGSFYGYFSSRKGFNGSTELVKVPNSYNGKQFAAFFDTHKEYILSRIVNIHQGKASGDPVEIASGNGLAIGGLGTHKFLCAWYKKDTSNQYK